MTMNDDELDLLASAYVDGEATPDEVAMVERDPELQARVEAFRAIQVDGSITPPPGLVDQHVAEAMEEWFEAISSTGATSAPAATATAGETATEIDDDTAGETAPVVDLAAASARRSERRSRQAPRRTMPSWLPAAAGLFIIGGGAIWAVGQSGGGDDTEAASIAADDSAEETSAESAELVESDDGDAEAMTAMADEAMEEESEDAMEDDAMADEGDDSASRADADAAAAAPADGGADESADDEEAEDAEEAFVDLEPQLFFDEVPDVDALADLPEPEPDLERSLCGPEIVTPTLGEPLGFIPVEVSGEPAEIYLFLDADGTEIRLLIDGDCQPLTP